MKAIAESNWQVELGVERDQPRGLLEKGLTARMTRTTEPWSRTARMVPAPSGSAPSGHVLGGNPSWTSWSCQRRRSRGRAGTVPMHYLHTPSGTSSQRAPSPADFDEAWAPASGVPGWLTRGPGTDALRRGWGGCRRGSGVARDRQPPGPLDRDARARPAARAGRVRRSTRSSRAAVRRRQTGRGSSATSPAPGWTTSWTWSPTYSTRLRPAGPSARPALHRRQA